MKKIILIFIMIITFIITRCSKESIDHKIGNESNIEIGDYVVTLKLKGDTLTRTKTIFI